MSLSSAVALLTLLGAPPQADSLRAATLTALAAVEGDSVAPVRARWEANRSSPLGLAFLALLTYDFADADRRFGALERAAGADSAIAAHARLGLARSALSRGNSAEADSILDGVIRAARASGLPLLEAEALLFKTLTATRIRGPAAGFPFLFRADSLIPRDDGQLAPRAKCIRSQLDRSRDLLRALDEGLAGASAARAAGVRRNEAFCLGMAGWAVALRGNTDSGVALFGKAAALQRQAHDRSGLTATLQWWGYYLFDAGSYGEARKVLSEALAEGRASGNLSPVAYAHMILARLMFVTGELDELETHIASAESLFTRQGDAQGHFILSGPAVERALAIRDTVAARAAAERYVSEAPRWGGIWPVEAHRSLAMVATDRGDWAVARVQLDSALVAARALGSPGYLTSVEQDLGVLALRRGDAAAARRILEPLAAGLSPTQAVFRHYTRIQLAFAYLQTGDVARAASTALTAADDLDRWRAGLDDRRLRQTAFDLRPLEDPTFAVADIISGLVAAGRGDLGFELAERRRARQLLDRMVLADALEETRLRADRPRAVMAALEEIRRAIPDDSTAIVEYLRGRPAAPTTVFVITRAAFQAQPLPPVPDLGRQVRRFTGLLEVGTSGDSLARSLGGALLDSVVALLPRAITRLVVIPDLELHGLPFEALRVRDTLVVERFAVSYAPSASVATRLWQRRRRSDPVSVLALGDPRFAERAEPGSQAALFLSAFGVAGGLGRLPGAAREARAVAGHADVSEVRVQGAASEASLKRPGLARYRIVHLATHALVDDRSPARTALALAPGDGGDGFVSTSEMAELHLAADLVVLSACRTGRGLVTGGEGVQGLAAPALEAGARAVLASGWLVGDRQSAKFMRRYYYYLARGHRLGDALRLTQLELLREGEPTSIWAGFTLVGDPHSVLPLHQPRATWPSREIAATVLALALLFYGATRMRRGRDGASTPSGSSPTTTQR